MSIMNPEAIASGPPETRVYLETNYGRMVLKLYNSTPLHRDNFVKLVKEGYYDGLLFHRVIKDFMIQGGDPESKNAMKGAMLGNGGPGYTVPAEFVDSLIHRKGALAAARLGDGMNPKKESSGSQFYIVQGRVWRDVDLAAMESRTG
ncbi:MAG: peptidylprolyl isomerase, partial [Bacteroidota bacterium]